MNPEAGDRAEVRSVVETAREDWWRARIEAAEKPRDLLWTLSGAPPGAALLAWKTGNVAVREEVAGLHTCPPDLLEFFYRNTRSRAVRRALALNPRTPWPIVADHDLAEDKRVRHPDCPVDRLVAAARSSRVGDSALQNPRLPAEVRHELLTGPWGWRLTRLLNNPNTTHEQALLLFDRAAAQGRRPSTLHWMWSANRNADPAWLADLADAYFVAGDGVIARIAENPATPPGTLERIVREDSWWERAAVNASCPPSALTWLAGRAFGEDGRRAPSAIRYSDDLAGILAAHPHTPLEALERVRVSDLSIMHVLDAVTVRATSAEHAQLLLALASSWPSTVADWMRTAAAAAAPAFGGAGSNVLARER